MKRWIALVLAVLMMLSAAMMSGCDEAVTELLTGNEKPTPEPKKAASAEYTKVFEDAGIATIDSLMIGQSYAAYVYVNEEGDVYRQEYGYLGDTVMTMIDTYYYYIPEGCDPAAVEEYKAEIQEVHDPVDALNCASVKYSDLACLNGGEYYVVTEKYEQVDKSAAVQELVKEGIVEEGAEIISMEMTDANMMEMGCVKR